MLAEWLKGESLSEFDQVLATSMTDLATLKGLVPDLARIPSIVYFHENQFAFPTRGARAHAVAAQITSIYTALAADQVVFNSAFNRDTFFEGANQLLKQMPDAVPERLLTDCARKAWVVPVPLATESPGRNRSNTVRSGIVWNHRWEYDKGPEQLLEIVKAYLALGGQELVHLVGQQFRQIPEPLSRVIDCLQQAGRLGQSGYIDDHEAYLSLLRECRVVLSTAHHEFQGLAVQEAMAEGCLPVVPDALVYPEYVPKHSRYESPEEAAVLLMRQQFSDPISLVDEYSWPKQAPIWRQLFSKFS